eukprot:jgi/Chlat1/6252/Chrsp44S05855
MSKRSGDGGAGGGDAKRGRKGRGHYVQAQQRGPKSDGIPLGVRGFLLSADQHKENVAARDAINFLTEYWEKDPRISSQGDGKAEPAAPSGRTVDSLLEAEIDDLKDHKQELFEKESTGCNSMVFIIMAPESERPGPGPCELTRQMLRDVAKTKKSRSKHCIRILPVDDTCYAGLVEIEKAVKPMLQAAFPTGEGVTPLKFSVVCDVRNNSGLKRMDVIDVVAKLVPAPHKVDLENPERCILVQVVKTTCALSILEEYKELAKYNMRVLAEPPKEEQTESAAKDSAAKSSAEDADAPGSKVENGSHTEVPSADASQQPKASTDNPT